MTTPTVSPITRKIAKIERAFLGIEDHGILTATLLMDYGGVSQSIGGYALDEPIRDSADNFLGRRGTAFGMEWIARVIRACGVSSWEEVQGRTVHVLCDGAGEWTARPIGIAPLPTEKGEAFIFDDLAAEHFPQGDAS